MAELASAPATEALKPQRRTLTRNQNFLRLLDTRELNFGGKRFMQVDLCQGSVAFLVQCHAEMELKNRHLRRAYK